MKPISLLVLVIFSGHIWAQSEWYNFTSIDNIGEVEVFDSMAYVTNSGGLLKIDLISGEEELLLPTNSDFAGQSLEIEFMSNGDAWVTSYGNQLNSPATLLYYDGETFEAFSFPDSLRISSTKHLRIYNEELWFLDFHGKLYSIKEHELIVHSTDLTDEIEYFDIDSKGILWAVNVDEIYAYDGTNVLSVEEIYPGEEVWQLDGFYIDKNDVLWMSVRPRSSGDLELMYIDDGGRHIVSSYFRMSKFFEHDSLGTCFTSKFNGFGYLQNDSLKFQKFDSVYVDIPWGDSNRAKFLKWEGNNAWFSGSNLEKPVLHRYVDETLYQYGHNRSFLGEITDMSADCNGTLYKSGESHLQTFRHGQWDTLFLNYQDEECYINHLELNPFTCELWGVGDHPYFEPCRSFWRFTENDIIEYDIFEGTIEDLAFMPDGRIVVTSQGNVSIIDTLGNREQMNIKDNMTFSNVFVSSKGQIWTRGTEWNPCFIKYSFFTGNGDDNWTELSYDSIQFFGNASLEVFEDETGDLWFQNQRFLVNYDGTNWTRNYLEMDVNGFHEALMDEKGNFWLATKKDGLVYWDRSQNSFAYYNTENSPIFSNVCLSIERIDNDLWIEHQHGLTLMKIDNIISNVATEKNEDFKLTIYPNPSTGLFNIKNTSRAERNYEIYDLNGQLVLAESSNEAVWSAQLDEGLYFIKLVHEGKAWVEKLIVTH